MSTNTTVDPTPPPAPSFDGPEYRIRDATPDDIPDMCTIYTEAFANDAFSLATFPSSIPASTMLSWQTKRFLSMLEKREMRTIAVVHVPTKKVAGWLRYQVPTVLTEEEKKERDDEKNRREEVRRTEGRDIMWPLGANLEVCDEKFGGLDRAKEKWMNYEEMYLFQLLCVSPSLQRRGLATLLLRHVLDQSDSESRKTYIEATPSGFPVYSKLGFKEVDRIHVDLTKYGGEGIASNVCMLRLPGPPRGD